MNLFRKLFGLGPKEPINTIKREIKSKDKRKEASSGTLDKEDISHRKIYPVLMSEKTTEFDLTNELVAVFHEREGAFANILIGHILLDEKDIDANGEQAVYQLRTYDKTEEDYETIRTTGKLNFDDYYEPFQDWNTADTSLNIKILSCKVSLLSSEKILSKKHMIEAHKLLNAEELLVSIPRRGLIFVCSKEISNEDQTSFLNLHAQIVLSENPNLELLCEDVFVLKNGEVNAIIPLNQISDILRDAS